MSFQGNQPSRWKIFALLTLGLFMLGFGSALLVYRQGVQDSIQATRQELLQLASTAALQVDAESLSNLSQPNQSHSATYLKAVGQLERLRATLPDLGRIYSLKQVGKRTFYVADAAPDQAKTPDGVPLKSSLMDPFDDHTSTFSLAQATGRAQVDEVPHQTRWGNWLSVYAPVKNSKGVIVGYLVLERDGKRINSGKTNTRYVLLSTFAIVFMLSLLFGWTVSGFFSTPEVSPVWERKKWTRSLLELSLVLAAAVVAVDGLGSQANRMARQEEESNLISSLEGSAKAERLLQSWRSGKAVLPADLRALTDGRLGLSYQVTNSLFVLISSSTAGAGAQADRVESDIKGWHEALLSRLVVWRAGIPSETFSLARIIGLAIFACGLGLVALRQSWRQDRRIEAAQSQSHVAQAEFRNVVESMPVGLFRIESGQCVYGNTDWDSLVAGIPGLDRTQILTNALHPDDRKQTLLTFDSAFDKGQRFQHSFRLIRADGSHRTMDCRGLPVFDASGKVMHLLVFTLDVTGLMKAQSEVERTVIELESKNALLSSAMGQLEVNLETMVQTLVKAVEAKDPYTAGHSERVTQYSLWLGQAVGLGPYEQRILQLGCLIHDVGKIGTPDAILTKPSRLLPEEFEQIQKHPEFGVKIIEGISLFEECIPIVRWHHERMNGKGYPDALVGEEIPYLVKISSIADVFDAMTSSRAYRAGLDVEEVFESMQKDVDAGGLDPGLFAVFRGVIAEKGVIVQTVMQASHSAA